MTMHISLAGIPLRNPLILASGILGSTGASLALVGRAGAGAVTAKSVCKEARKGHPSPVMATYEGGMLNAVGLSNPGMGEFMAELQTAISDSPAPVIASIFTGSGEFEEFGEVAAMAASLKPAMIEVDISCPHVKNVNFAADPDAAARVTKIVRAHTGAVPISLKLSPNAANIVDVARAVEAAGAHAITAVNTLGPGMMINADARKPVLGNGRGGVSGYALKPIAIRCVYDIYAAVHIPIIGTGGVQTGIDAIEMMMAGATTVGVGTAVFSRGPEVFANMTDEMHTWMQDHGVHDIREIIGAAHQA